MSNGTAAISAASRARFHTATSSMKPSYSSKRIPPVCCFPIVNAQQVPEAGSSAASGATKPSFTDWSVRLLVSTPDTTEEPLYSAAWERDRRVGHWFG